MSRHPHLPPLPRIRPPPQLWPPGTAGTQKPNRSCWTQPGGNTKKQPEKKDEQKGTAVI